MCERNIEITRLKVSLLLCQQNQWQIELKVLYETQNSLKQNEILSRVFRSKTAKVRLGFNRMK